MIEEKEIEFNECHFWLQLKSEMDGEQLQLMCRDGDGDEWHVIEISPKGIGVSGYNMPGTGTWKSSVACKNTLPVKIDN